MDNFMQFLTWMRNGSLAVGGGIGALLLWRAALSAYDQIYQRIVQRQQDRLTKEHIETQNKLNNIRAIVPDNHGRYPLLYGENGILRDPNNLRAFTLEAVREQWPALEQLDAVVRAVVGAGGWPSASTADRMLPEPAAVNVQWPDRVTLGGMLRKYHVNPGYHNILLGETVDVVTSERRAVTGDMVDFVHVLISGSSGWGKSTALETMAKQLVMGGDCDLASSTMGSTRSG